MKEPNNSINSLGDLDVYGLNCLTGEACAFNMRLLFDVNEHGIRQLELYFGFSKLETQSNWNSSVNGEPAIGSVMLSADTAWDFGAYMMLIDQYDVVIPNQDGHHGVYGFNTQNDIGREYLEKLREDGLRLLYGTRGHDGTGRNQHQFTGRTV